MMRIAFLTTDNRDAQRSYGEEKPRFGPAPSVLLEGFSLWPGEIEVHVVSCTQRLLRAPERIAGNIYYHSVRVPKWGWLRSGYAGCVRAVRRKLREIGPDLVHGQGTERDCALEAVFSGFPNVLTVHGNMRAVARSLNHPLWTGPGLMLFLTGRLETVALRRCGGLIALSSYSLREAGPLARHTWVIPNGFPLSMEGVERREVSPPELFVPANLITYKNQAGLMEALDPLAERVEFKLVLSGKGAESDYGRRVLEMAAARPWVEYRGNLDVAGLREAYARAAVMVLPTLEDNCPMAVIEALAAGVPVAASRIGGIPDLIRDGVTGLLFNPRKSDDMREVVGRLLTEAELVEQLGCAGRQHAQHNLHPKEIARRHLEVYGEVMGRGGKCESGKVGEGKTLKR